MTQATWEMQNCLRIQSFDFQVEHLISQCNLSLCGTRAQKWDWAVCTRKGDFCINYIKPSREFEGSAKAGSYTPLCKGYALPILRNRSVWHNSLIKMQSSKITSECNKKAEGRFLEYQTASFPLIPVFLKIREKLKVNPCQKTPDLSCNGKEWSWWKQVLLPEMK